MSKKRTILLSTISLVLIGAITAAIVVPLLTNDDSSSSMPSTSSSSSNIPSAPSLLEMFTITWKNYDGTVLKIDEEVALGTLPTYAGNEPTRVATAQFTYTFAGWSPAVVVATSDATYTATYDDTVNKYPITWKNDDGTVLAVQNVAYGTMPVFDDETPTKQKDAEFTYTFDKWSPEIVLVTKAATYTATYTETRNNYTVTWLNEDGTLLKTDENIPYGTIPEYIGPLPTKASEPHRTFAFLGWSPVVSAVVGDVTYTAEFSATFKTFTITLDLNGGVFANPETALTFEVTYSSDFSLPTPNTPTNSPFGGWYYNDERIADEFGESLASYAFTEDITVVAEYFFPIYTRADLENITNELSGTYRLMNDLDLSGDEWIPLNGFAGDFDGQGFTISGMTIFTAYEHTGLFGVVNEAIIANLTMTNTHIEYESVAGVGDAFVGVFVGSSHNSHDLTLHNLTNENAVINVTERSWGYVGYGGILGNYESLGGTTLVIADSKNKSDISGELYQSLGGLVGRLMTKDSVITVNSSYNSGALTTSLYTGGLIGDFLDTNSVITINDSYNDGEITGLAMLGGLIGDMRLKDRGVLTINNSYNKKDIISPSNNNGGLIGSYNASDFAELIITGSYNEGNISGEENLGGLVGSIARSGQRQFMPEVHVSNSYNIGDVAGSRGGVGGLFGYIFNYFTVTNSFNAGDVSAGREHVGGLVGWGQSGGIITNSLNFGTVTTNTLAGSIIGRNHESAVVMNNTHFTNEVFNNSGQLFVGPTAGGTYVDITTIDTTFFSDTLLWEEAVWDLTNVDVLNAAYPTLKH